MYAVSVKHHVPRVIMWDMMPGVMYMSGACPARKRLLGLPDNQKLPEGSPSLSGLCVILSALAGTHRILREGVLHRPSHSIHTCLSNPAGPLPTT